MEKNIAFLFPGQGSQYVGMCGGLIEANSRARARVEEAGDILGFDIGKLLRNGPEEELGLTANTQPAILLASVIALEALRERVDVTPVVCAGHSLGEFSACWSAGVIDFADALRIVRRRGELMQSAVPAGVGAMAAIIGMASDVVEQVCRETDGEVWPANFNSPQQTVIAGKTGAVEKAMELAMSKGARKAVRLQVSAPFHTPLMSPARDGLADYISSFTFHAPAFPVIRNVDAGLYKLADEITDGLTRQVTDCVRWEDSMRKLSQMDVCLAVEIGPGKVLSGLLKRIDKTVDSVQVGSPEGLNRTLEVL